MWEFNEFWEGGSLAKEWSDNARTPDGVLENIFWLSVIQYIF